MKTQKSNKKTVLVAMSGGVDSSIAALIMKRQGYNVIGCFMKNWSDTKDLTTGECQWRQERRVALKIVSMLDIPLMTIDSEKEYKKIVVSDMFKKYKQGITPNPDVLCNEKIKFPLLWKAAQKLKADFIVTGHYARIKKTRNGYEMLRAKDETKDQSYFLYRLNQEDLLHTLFPIGEYTKKEIRLMAEKNKFPNYNKKSTVGICFIGKINLKDFLKEKIKQKKGKILDPNGNQIGIHDGIYYYTIGQRLGPRFGIEVSKASDSKRNLKRWYVARKDVKNNIIVAAPEGHQILLRKNIIIKEPHWINTNNKNPKRVLARIRQVGELLPAKLTYNSKMKKWYVQLEKAITGVSEGQAIVLYEKTRVLGGGTISF